MSASRIICLLLVSVPLCAMAGESNLPRIAVIPVFQDSQENFIRADLISAAEEVFALSGRFVVVDVTGHELYSGEPADQNLRIQTIGADMSVDLFMLLDVSEPESWDSATQISGDSVFTPRNTSIDITGRFYSSGGTLLGSVREKKYSGGFQGGASLDLNDLAISGVEQVALRSLAEIFPYEFSFTVGSSPDLIIPVGTDGGVEKGMVFAVVARSFGIPRSEAEYRALRSHGIMQIIDADNSGSRGRLLAGNLVEGAVVTAIENSAPALLSLSYSVLPTEVVPGDDLSGEEAETSRLMSQAEFSGSTGRWGLSLGGTLFSGVFPRMSSIGVRGEMGTRLPLSAPDLALRLGIGFEAAFLTQNTRADSISSSANTATIAGTAGANFEWMMSSRFGLHAGCIGRIGTEADSWTVKSWTGYNRDALPGELYYASIKQPPVSFTLGLTYMIY